MSHAVSSSSSSSADRTARLWGLGAFLVAAVYLTIINTNVPDGENGGGRELVVSIVLVAVVAAFLFLWLVPRVRNADRTALVLGVLALLAVAAFWSGLSLLLAAAAWVVGSRGTGGGARAGQVLAALSVVLMIVAIVADQT